MDRKELEELERKKTEIEENIFRGVQPISPLLGRQYYKINKEKNTQFKEEEFYNNSKKMKKLYSEVKDLTNKKIKSLDEINDYLKDKELYKTLLTKKQDLDNSFKFSDDLQRRIKSYEDKQQADSEDAHKQEDDLRIINRLAIEETCENAPRSKTKKDLVTQPIGGDKVLLDHIINNKDKNLKIVVTGESGMGKTWLLAKLFLSFCNEIDNSPIMPLFVDLKDDLRKDNYLMKLLVSNKPKSKQKVKHIPILVLDGFNEISDEQREVLNVDLKLIEKNYSNICWIITTQPQTIKQSWLKDYPYEDKGDYEFYRVLEITEGFVDELIRNYLLSRAKDISENQISKLGKYIKGLDVSIKRSPYYIRHICELYIKNDYSTENIPSDVWKIIDQTIEKKWKDDFKDLSPQKIKNLKMLMGVIGIYELFSDKQILIDEKYVEWFERFEDADILSKDSKEYFKNYLQKQGQWKDIFVFDHDKTRDYAVAYLIKYMVNNWRYSDKGFKEWLLIACLLKENMLEPLSMAADSISINMLFKEINKEMRHRLISHIVLNLTNRPSPVLTLIDKINDNECIDKAIEKFYEQNIIDNKGDVFIGIASILKKRTRLFNEFIKKSSKHLDKLIKTRLICFITNPSENIYLIAEILRLINSYTYNRKLYFEFIESVLQEVVQRDEDVKEAVIDMLDMKGKYIKEIAVRSLYRVIHSDSSVKSKAVRLIDDENQFIRQAVIKSIKGAVKQGDNQCIEAVIKALQSDEDYHVRIEAIECLSSIIESNNTAKKEIINRLNDEGYLVKEKAVEVLGRLKNDKPVKEAISEKLYDKDYIVRDAAIEALTPLLRHDKILQEKFAGLFEDEYFADDYYGINRHCLYKAFKENNYNTEELRAIFHRINFNNEDSIKEINEIVDVFSEYYADINFSIKVTEDVKETNQKENMIIKSKEEIICNCIKDNLNAENLVAVISQQPLCNILPKHYKEISDLSHISRHTSLEDFIYALYDKHFPVYDSDKGLRSPFFHNEQKEPIFFNYCTFALSKYLENIDKKRAMENPEEIDKIKYIFKTHFIDPVGFPIEKIKNKCSPCIFKIFNPEKEKGLSKSILQETILADWKTYWKHLNNIIDNASKHKKYRCRLVIAKVKQNKRPIVAVVDDGEGFPANIDEIERLFQTGNTHRDGGTGLGLTKDMIRELHEMGFKVLLKDRTAKWYVLDYLDKTEEIRVKTHTPMPFEYSYELKEDSIDNTLTKSSFNRVVKKYGFFRYKDGDKITYMNNLLGRDDLFETISKVKEISDFCILLYKEYLKNKDDITYLKRLNRAILEETFFKFIKKRDISLQLERNIYKYSNKTGGVVIIGK